MEDKFLDFVFEGYKNIEFAPDLNTISNLMKSNPVNSCNFINFNYTNTLQILLDNIINFDIERIISASDFNELHIHGSINGSIIIGVDNVGQFKSELRRNYIGKYCVKRLINESMNNNNEISFKEIIDKSDLIYIYGLSLGASDLSRKEIIRDWLLKNNDHYLIVFQHNPEFVKLNKAFYPAYRDEFEDLKANYVAHTFYLSESQFFSSELNKRVILVDSASVLDFKLIEEEQMN